MDETGGFFFPRFVWGGGLEESIAIPPNDSRKGEQKDDDADIFMDKDERSFVGRWREVVDIESEAQGRDDHDRDGPVKENGERRELGVGI